MTVVAGPTPAEAGPAGPGQEIPARADGLVLLGEVSGSGYRNAPSLARRIDCQTIQLTRLLYLILEAIDGVRDHAQIASAVSESTGRSVNASDVAQLIDTKLRPAGLLSNSDGTQPELVKANPLLALRFRWMVSDPRVTNRVTRPFSLLFHPVVIVPVLVAFGLVCHWTLFEKGLASAAHNAFDRPGLLLAVFALSVLSAGFHEFGHAAAARYGGAAPGAMGVGLYLVWPAFYTDVTDSYRLGRGGRIRTDLGGLYFNTIFTIAAFGAWWLTGWEALLLIIPAQLLQMLQQLSPLLRFDGYHILADLTGVPDMYQRIKPTFLGLLPHRWHRAESKVLKPWARIVVTLWMLIVVPVLVLSSALMVLALPRVLATAWRSLKHEAAGLVDAFDHAAVASIGASILSILALVIPILGMTYIVVRLVRRTSEKVWRATADRPGRRKAAHLSAVAAIALLAYAWWPHGDNYRPIEAYERGTVADAVTLVTRSSPRLQSGRLHSGEGHDANAIWPDRTTDVPSRERPTLAVVMVPVNDDNAPTWVFPFNRPAPPGEGDNQALAVNTKDGTVVYQVAFALVWVTDGSVTNTNEAYAFASCTNCAAVAVGFQVVLVLGDVDVAIPQNLAGSVTYSCVSCVAYALASQLVVTLPGELGPTAMDELARIWDEIKVFGENIADVPLSDLQAHLDGYKSRIVAIIERDAQQVGTTTTSIATATTTEATPTATAQPQAPTTEPPLIESPQTTHDVATTTATTATPAGSAQATATPTTNQSTTTTTDSTTDSTIDQVSTTTST
jgi:putative peptide zinc metalloprotease protein